ncbi:hypothetical protein MKX01_020691 [Papaver californicum]|nr:hypothetical protein MKX01_020691 [Papaver californicum]
MAVLANKPSFIVFLVFNSSAMFLDTNGPLLLMTLLCNLLAILAMMVAFVMGTYSVLSHLLGLALPVCILGCVFFVLSFLLIYKMANWLHGFMNELRFSAMF